jgi:predicted transcriptional regulator
VSRTQLTITVSPEVGRYVEELSEEWGVKKSAAIERALKDHRERHMEDLLREGYQEMAEHDLALHKEFERVDSETPLPEYVEK